MLIPNTLSYVIGPIFVVLWGFIVGWMYDWPDCQYDTSTNYGLPVQNDYWCAASNMGNYTYSYYSYYSNYYYSYTYYYCYDVNLPPVN